MNWSEQRKLTFALREPKLTRYHESLKQELFLKALFILLLSLN